MLITQPRSKKYQNFPRTYLTGPGGAVWGKNQVKKSRETLPLRSIMSSKLIFFAISKQIEKIKFNYVNPVAQSESSFSSNQNRAPPPIRIKLLLQSESLPPNAAESSPPIRFSVHVSQHPCQQATPAYQGTPQIGHDNT